MYSQSLEKYGENIIRLLLKFIKPVNFIIAGREFYNPNLFSTL